MSRNRFRAVALLLISGAALLFSCTTPGEVTSSSTISSSPSSSSVDVQEEPLILVASSQTLGLGDTVTLTCYSSQDDAQTNPFSDFDLEFEKGEDLIEVSEGENSVTLKALKIGDIRVRAVVGDLYSQYVDISINQGDLSFTIEATRTDLALGESARLFFTANKEDLDIDPVYSVEQEKKVLVLEDNSIRAYSTGEATITASWNGIQSENSIRITVNEDEEEYGFTLCATSTTAVVDDAIELYSFDSGVSMRDISMDILEGENLCTLRGYSDHYSLQANKPGTVVVQASYGIRVSNPVTIEIVPERDNPYYGVDRDEFYEDYTPASSPEDAYFRSVLGLMSGDISEQDQEPTIAEDRPVDGDKFIRNTTSLYSEDFQTYYVLDADGDVVDRIYRSGGYVTLEQVAAFIYAWQTVPENYDEDRYNNDPERSIWGEYLRLNNSYFSGDTSDYPYEPELPENGPDGRLEYYEVDIGTTGTDCDPAYPAEIYNDGESINRGAARIVYARYWYSGPVTAARLRYVFYTYNHYNDFQEYLNYENGWGEMFGNITGGGKISSKNPYECNPTPYVDVSLKEF